MFKLKHYVQEIARAGSFSQAAANLYVSQPSLSASIKRLETQTSTLLRKPVYLTNLIDESLIGGFLISVDGKLIDASIKKKIEDMSLRIKANTEGGNLL